MGREVGALAAENDKLRSGGLQRGEDYCGMLEEVRRLVPRVRV